MKKRSFQQKLFMSLLVLTICLGAYGFPWASEKTIGALDIAVKVSNIDEKLKLLERLIPSDANQPKKTSILKLREMLHGTDWIDAQRAVVFGMTMAEPDPEMAIIIPYSSPNSKFESAFNATAGPDYYVISLPPGKSREEIPQFMVDALVSASAAKPEDFLSIEMAVKRLLDKGEQKIRESLGNLDKLASDSSGQNGGVTSGDIKEMVDKFLETAGQLEMLDERIDFTDEKITVTLKASAIEDSELSRLFVRGPMMAYLNAYQANEQINFRAGRYDNQGFMKLFGNVFGKLYEKAGIDFSQLSGIANDFTGETAGGLSITEDGLYVEMIGVLDDKYRGTDYAKTRYLPWLEKYMKNITDVMEKRAGQKIEGAFVQTPGTTIDGHEVSGVKLSVPFGPAGQNRVSAGAIPYEVRMATVDNFFLMAPNDKRIKSLIALAKTLEEEVYMGSLFKMDMDIGSYLTGVMNMAGGGTDVKALPRTGKIRFIADVENGRLLTSSTIRISDVQALVNYSKEIGTLAAASYKPTAAGLPNPVKKNIRPVVVVQDADYWVDRGGLCATYGNDKAAIKFYQKALTLDPERSDAYFGLGLSYGGTGEFEKALDAINKAISLDPEEALYYYGRGRTYLLFGKNDLAMADIRLAADKGNKDAMGYLGLDKD